MHRFHAVMLAVAVAVALSGRDTLAGPKVNVGADKAFDFKAARTWGWNPTGPGEVKMARTPDDDPESFRKLAEPIILDAVNGEMPKRGLQQSSSLPDLQLTYYLLLTAGAAAQTLGQFLPATPVWGLPPFAPATQSLTVMNQGSLVFDFASKGNVVWRGVVQAQVSPDADDKKREEKLREGVRELLKRYPPKS
jgi:hypothetical protein